MQSSTARDQAQTFRSNDVRTALRAGLGNLERLQGEDGAWPGDYGGPMFLLPMYIALAYATHRLPTGAQREGMIRYFLSTQNPDGSIGLHAEDRRGSMFTSVLVYMSLRMLGVAADDQRVDRLRQWIHENGSPLGAASWGKFTLCLLGLYEWSGIAPILPELWLLPHKGPFHPGQLWCHCRQVYLPMAWLYGSKSQVPLDPLLRSLREELYPQGYEKIEWRAHRDTVSANDAYRPITPALKAANRMFEGMERAAIKPVRQRALDAVFEHIVYEDQVTSYIDIGPVNKVLNTFVHHFKDPGGEHFTRAFEACAQYMWDGHDGIKMQSYNNSKLWDTAFALQAILAASFEAQPHAMTERAYGFVRDNQILEDVPNHERYFRHPSRGGWPFSTRSHGWPITDCTSEGLKCALALEGRFREGIPEALLRDAVKLIFTWQNDDGGFATYERQRGGAWIEALNPSQVFGDIMVDYSYVECTSACLQALAHARKRFPDLKSEIDRVIGRAERFLRKAQREDGSFEGSWAVCFTYGTWFGVSGLLAAGAPTNDPAIVKACSFLLSKQRADGAWGEHGDSCREHRYVEAPEGSVVQTAWALSALVRARHVSVGAQAKAVEFLLSRQAPDGSYAREPLVGVFNRTCLINYDNYRHVFPLWAMAEWEAAQGAKS